MFCADGSVLTNGSVAGCSVADGSVADGSVADGSVADGSVEERPFRAALSAWNEVGFSPCGRLCARDACIQITATSRNLWRSTGTLHKHCS